MKFTAWLAAACVFFMLGNAQAESTRNEVIETVIQKQIDAFKAHDFKTAFDFAAPAIQARFGTPERFAFVVIHHYPMVWRPNNIEYLALEQGQDYALQNVMITDRENTLHFLVYEMIAFEHGWRIGGVRIIEQRRTDT